MQEVCTGAVLSALAYPAPTISELTTASPGSVKVHVRLYTSSAAVCTDSLYCTTTMLVWVWAN